ncbi:MAG: hypothetical protein ACRDJH_11055 [Thermomicrobiales bacterium]
MTSTTISAVRPALARLNELADLPPDWDSYGANPPNPAAIAKAREILLELTQPLRLAGTRIEPSTIGARADGGIMIEWGNPETALEVHIEPDGSVGYLYEDNTSRPARQVEADDVSLTDLTPLLHDVLSSLRAHRGDG